MIDSMFHITHLNFNIVKTLRGGLTRSGLFSFPGSLRPSPVSILAPGLGLPSPVSVFVTPPLPLPTPLEDWVVTVGGGGIL